ncbi:MAG: patatin-like phospholipase family protein [Chitinophagaceae bacterium]
MLLCFHLTVNGQAPQQRPKVGITLSGGGAKGLAHIGILKAIDSAGLQVDVVTGTSMGAIIGALYASGYTADSIEQMVRAMDWEAHLTNTSILSRQIMEEKDEYNRYAIELPWIKNRFRLPSGVLESQEIWLKLSELFFPVHKIQNFNSLPRKFRCVATDVSNGKAVIHDSGLLVYALRSSMAIPSVFTAVDYKDQKLVDGGIVRNFPVEDAKQLGASIVIGSNVAGGLLAKEKIQNVFQVMLQIAFFREDEDAKKQRTLCNVYIHQRLDDYNMGSFNSAAAIIDSGIEAGRKMYPIFKRMADSLNAIYASEKTTYTLPDVTHAYVERIIVKGLQQTDERFFLHRTQLKDHRYYTAEALSEAVRRAFGTRYYRKIVYYLEPGENGAVQLVFDVEENPLTFTKLGIHYNTFTGVSLIGNVTSRNFFLPYSRSMVTLNLGENVRVRGEHTQFFGKLKNFTLNASLQLEELKHNRYNGNFDNEGNYRLAYVAHDMNIGFSNSLRNSVSIGNRYEHFRYKTTLPTNLNIDGTYDVNTAYLIYKHNSLNSSFFPKYGAKGFVEIGWVHNQTPRLQYSVQERTINGFDSLRISFNNYPIVRMRFETYVPISNRLTVFSLSQAGINFNYKQRFTNDFYVGGLQSTYRNQIVFAGLDEGMVAANSIGAFQLGIRWQAYSNFHVMVRSNVAMYNFIPTNYSYKEPVFLTGYAVGIGYNFVLGPLEISAMYSDQAQRLLPYLSLGVSF